jgi:cytochrome c-type biogenesis protein
MDTVPYKRLITTLAWVALVLSVSVIVSVLANLSDLHTVNIVIDSISGITQGFLANIVGITGLFAFSAGVVSAVNPCGFAMLPAYLGLYMSTSIYEKDSTHYGKMILKGLFIGCCVGLGVLSLFLFVGLITGFALNFIRSIMEWVGLLLGVGLITIGIWLMNGGRLYTGLTARIGQSIGNPTQISLKGFFLFGVSYGVASLSCTLPIFLSVVGINLNGSSIYDSMMQFALYGAGMGSMILFVTLSMAILKGVMIRYIKLALPYVERIGFFLVVLSGMYIVFYWMTIGGVQIIGL